LAAVETLEILSPGPLTTVQDLGRFGYGRYGVAPSGAVDTFALRIGNLLVENQEDEACIEITLFGLKVKALRDLSIAVTGADLTAFLDDTPVDMWRAQTMKRGQVLAFRGHKRGCRAYLALGGGITVAPVMDSRSTNLGSRFGGLDGRPLRKGDIISSDSPSLHLRTKYRAFDRELIPSYPEQRGLRVVPGPQDDHFTRETKQTFFHSVFTVSSQSNRIGIRLEGPPLQAKAGLETSIISEGVASGTIQVPGDGLPIIILGETVTGGYRKIATVITADLPSLGQLKPADKVNFCMVSMDEAYEAIKKAEEMIKRFRSSQ